MLFITFPAADEILVVRSVSTGTLVRDVTLFDVAFGNGIFVGVGGSGLSTSFDGLTWTLNVPGGDLSGIAYGNGSFVAVGSAGVSFTSPDGMSWAPRWSGTFHGFRGVRFGNGLFVALRDDNTIVTSVDGAAWTLRAAGLPGFELLDLFFDNGVFAVIGADRSAISMAADFIFMTSSDGISWRTVRAPDDVGPFRKVAFATVCFWPSATGPGAHGAGYWRLSTACNGQSKHPLPISILQASASATTRFSLWETGAQSSGQIASIPLRLKSTMLVAR